MPTRDSVKRDARQPDAVKLPAVLFLTSQFLPRVGGAEVLTLREAVALRSLGHQMRIVTLRLERAWPASEERDGIAVRRTGGLFVGGKLRLRFGAQWLAELMLMRELIQSRATYDIIHMRQVSFLARPVVLAALLLRKPVVVQIANAGPGKHVPVPAGAQTTLYVGSLDPTAPYLRIAAGSWGAADVDTLRRSQWLAELTLRLLRRRGVTFLSVSERTTTYLVEDGLRAEQFVLLPTGIEPEQYEAAFQRHEAHAEAGGPRLVLSVARYRFEKGLDILLHAWKRVREQGIQARLMLVGGGQLEAQLAAMIAALGLEDSVDLAGMRNDVRSLLGDADVFVLPSRYEGLPNALLEAMAAGLPCVATRVSGNEDVIVDGESGLLVPPGDPVALADALAHVLTQPAQARVLGRAARDRIVRYYDRRNLMRELEAIYERLVSAGGSKRHTDARHGAPVADDVAAMEPTAIGQQTGQSR